MILRQAIHQRRRQQERLTAITRHEVLTHPGVVLNRPDTTTATAYTGHGARVAALLGDR
jgi:hypothetical protein